MLVPPLTRIRQQKASIKGSCSKLSPGPALPPVASCAWNCVVYLLYNDGAHSAVCKHVQPHTNTYMQDSQTSLGWDVPVPRVPLLCVSGGLMMKWGWAGGRISPDLLCPLSQLHSQTEMLPVLMIRDRRHRSPLACPRSHSWEWRG